MILKPLYRAIEDGDHVRAVIASSGMNQDGRTIGITQPNGSAQEDLIKSVYEKAGLDIMDCGFIEAHGTGKYSLTSKVSRIDDTDSFRDQGRGSRRGYGAIQHPRERPNRQKATVHGFCEV